MEEVKGHNEDAPNKQVFGQIKTRRFMDAGHYEYSGLKTFPSEQTFRLPASVYKMKELDIGPVTRFRFKGR